MASKKVTLLFIFSLPLLVSSPWNKEWKGNKDEGQIVFTKDDFPAVNSKTLIYDSDFGETTSTLQDENDQLVYKNVSDDFKYIQKLIVNDEGVYVTETYQKLDVLLFFHRESTVTYNQPMLRIPLPLHENQDWVWQGEQTVHNHSFYIMVTGRVLGLEKVETPAGTFNAVKVQTIVSGKTRPRSMVTEWYVPKIGMVKMEAKIFGGGFAGFVQKLLGYENIEFELKEMKPKQL